MSLDFYSGLLCDALELDLKGGGGGYVFAEAEMKALWLLFRPTRLRARVTRLNFFLTAAERNANQQ